MGHQQTRETPFEQGKTFPNKGKPFQTRENLSKQGKTFPNKKNPFQTGKNTNKQGKTFRARKNTSKQGKRLSSKENAFQARGIFRSNVKVCKWRQGKAVVSDGGYGVIGGGYCLLVWGDAEETKGKRGRRWCGVGPAGRPFPILHWR